MKQLLLSSLIVCAGLFVTAQSDKTPYMTKSLANDAINNVRVETSGGSISVTGVNPSEARVEVYIQGNNWKDRLSKEEIEKRLEDYQLDVSASNNKLTAIAKQKNRQMNWRRGLSISFRVFVPEKVSTDLNTSGGSIALMNLNGTHDFQTSGGSLDLEKVSGKITGRTSGGSIDLRQVNDDVDVSTSGGSIEAENCSGDLKLSTSGGSLTLESLKGNIKATTSGGSVHGKHVQGDLSAHTSGGSVDLRDLSCSLETSTSGGNIDVEMTELGKFVKIENSSGNVSLTIPGNKGVNLKLSADKIRVGTLSNFNGSKEDDEINGTLNGGGVPITVRAGSGHISLELK